MILKRILDEEINKLTAHWNPIPNRLEGIAPKVIEQRLLKGVAQAQLEADQAQIKEAYEVLDIARAAILDACYCEDGLDASTGHAIMNWITELLGDDDTYKPKIEGWTDQTTASKVKAIEHYDRAIERAAMERVFEAIEKLFPVLGFNDEGKYDKQIKAYQALKSELLGKLPEGIKEEE